MALDERLLRILACPEDKGPLLYFESDNMLYNPRLKRRYRISDGIPVLLVEEAEPVSDQEHARLTERAVNEGIEPTFTDPA
ncbi:MAG: Trm112 family protein [Acidimicrobiales bacterium]